MAFSGAGLEVAHLVGVGHRGDVELGAAPLHPITACSNVTVEVKVRPQQLTAHKGHLSAPLGAFHIRRSLFDPLIVGTVLNKGELTGLYVLLSRTQAGPGRTVKQEQEEISPNHVQRINLISVVLEITWCANPPSSGMV